MELTGGPTQPPTKSGLSLVDFCGGYVAALATLAGVWQARRDGRGCDADLSLFETALAQLTYIGVWVASRGFEPRRMADSAHQTMVPFQAFPTADGWIMVACPKQRLWERFCDAIGRPELPGDERFADFAARDRNRDVLVPLLAAALSDRTTAEWLEQLGAHGVPERPGQRRRSGARPTRRRRRGATSSPTSTRRSAWSAARRPRSGSRRRRRAPRARADAR